MAIPSTLPPTALPALKQIHALLHLTHHRNKNQHRLAKWWSALSMLRRNVDKLILELEKLEALGMGKTARKERREVEGRVVERVEFLREGLMEKCYLAFSNVVADNQYAALGLMLLATLARLNRVISPPASKVVVVERPLAEGMVGMATPESHVGVKEDFGEKIERSVGGVGIDGEAMKGGEVMSKSERKAAKKRALAEEVEAMKELEAAATPTPKPPKKKRKKGDAFDDLFSGLV